MNRWNHLPFNRHLRSGGGERPGAVVQRCGCHAQDLK